MWIRYFVRFLTLSGEVALPCYRLSRFSVELFSEFAIFSDYPGKLDQSLHL